MHEYYSINNVQNAYDDNNNKRPLTPKSMCRMHMMMIGLNPGPRARTVKNGTQTPENQARSRPEPIRSPQGHSFGGGTPVHTSRYQGCDLNLISHSPTANQGGTECHHCSKIVALCTPTSQRDQISQGHKFAGARTYRQAPTPCSMQMPHGVTPQQMHTSQGLHPRAKAPYWPPPRHSNTY